MQSGKVFRKICVEEGLIFDRFRFRLFARARIATSPSFADELSLGLFAFTQIIGIEFDTKPPEFYCSATLIDAIALTVAAQHILAFEFF